MGKTMKKEEKRQIVLAKTVEDFRVTRERRRDLGEQPDIEKFDRPVALMWKSDGDADDVEKAQQYASSEGYKVFLYLKSERDPLEQAKADLMKRAK